MQRRRPDPFRRIRSNDSPATGLRIGREHCLNVIAYCTVSVTAPELVTVCVCGGVLPPPPLLPPHPAANAAVVRTIAAQANTHTRLAAAHLRRAKASGSRRMGRKISAVAAPGSVSVNTTVIW